MAHSARHTDFFTPALPRVFAHRGAAGDCPENTMVAFEHAARVGARYFELDVRMSRDGEVVVSHDDDLLRTCGREGHISSLEFAQIEGFDAGYEFASDDRYPFRGLGVRVPRLSEVFVAFPNTLTIVEIKQKEPSLVAELLKVVDRHSMRRKVLIASELQEPIDEFRTLAPEIPTNFAYGEVAEFLQALAGLRSDYTPLADALQIPSEYEGWKLATPEAVALAHQLGVEVHVWTVNEEPEMRRLLSLGVDGLITDFPARGMEVAGAQTIERSI